MASTQDTIRIVGGVKLVIGGQVDAVTDQLVRAWAAAWNVLVPEWSDALREATESVYDGTTKSWRAWARSERARQALEATARALDALAAQSGVTISASLPGVVDTTITGHSATVASQLPSASVVNITWGRTDPEALTAIVKRTTQQITARTKPISADATRAIKQTLVKGVATGINPKVAAREMLARTRGEFAGGLTRAMTIARTEMLDAHRESAQAADEAASDVLTGWRWTSTLSVRTCPSCLAMNGTVHPVSEPGPLDHPNGRCTRSPVTKSWKDLGIAIPEPEPVTLDARSWFDGLTEPEQIRIMGRDRLALLKSGRIGWDDLPVRRRNPDWRDSYQVRPVRDLQARAAA